MLGLEIAENIAVDLEDFELIKNLILDKKIELVGSWA